MRHKQKRPDGLTALALLMVLASIGSIWNLIHHSAPLLSSLFDAVVFLLLALGIALQSRITFVAFIVLYIILLSSSVLGFIFPGPYSRAHLAFYVGAKVALLFWIFCYRRHFFKGKYVSDGDDQIMRGLGDESIESNSGRR